MTYQFTNPEHSSLLEIAEDGKEVIFGWESGTPAWRRFVESGKTAAPYVAPPEPEPLTAEEKLANAGLTVEELKQLLGLDDDASA